jgi:hypothetical protein
MLSAREAARPALLPPARNRDLSTSPVRIGSRARDAHTETDSLGEEEDIILAKCFDPTLTLKVEFINGKTVTPF